MKLGLPFLDGFSKRGKYSRRRPPENMPLNFLYFPNKCPCLPSVDNEGLIRVFGLLIREGREKP